MNEIFVDNFAGGGGASTGIEMAIGRDVDIAINHDPAAIAMHRANHPGTKHYCESVWDIDPAEACAGHPVALAWFSPDCTHFSKAKGGKPKSKHIRGLAWIAVKWAQTVKPRVIILENVEEFQDWGPLRKDGHPDKRCIGKTFRRFLHALGRYGYRVEHRELRACDYGAPTTRKRFFLIARCDGKPIVWPESTHGDPDSLMVRSGLEQPYRTAAEIIDWSIPCPSIFGRKKPLCENTMRRIAKGLKKFVFDNPAPFIVLVNHKGEGFRGQKINKPLQTITSKHGFGVVVAELTPFIMVNEFKNKGSDIKEPLHTILTGNHHYVVAPTIITYHGEKTPDEVRGQSVSRPIDVIDTSNRYGLVTAFISKYFAGGYAGAGSKIENPLPTVTAVDHNALVMPYMMHYYGESIGSAVTDPVGTITAQGQHIAEVEAFLIKYYGSDVGQNITDPLHTITSKDRFGLVMIQGLPYQIIDIGMRMLSPRELFDAQGFPHDYIIDRDADGNKYPKFAQVARCGNAVPPPFAEALTRANLPEYCPDRIRKVG
ncbi:MAG: DNA cytosine methyltransferase [Acidaminococcaceae bacterium]|nr:DNA cytosine methyltransferase [Acidaminococcaceae bacterium]